MTTGPWLSASMVGRDGRKKTRRGFVQANTSAGLSSDGW